MRKKKKLKHVKRRMMAGLFCLALLFGDLTSAVPAWAKEADPIIAENTYEGSENSGEEYNLGEGIGVSGEEYNPGKDNDGSTEMDSAGEGDAEEAQNQDEENLDDAAQDSDEASNAVETPEPDQEDGDSEPAQEGGEDDVSGDTAGDAADNAGVEEEPDLSEETEGLGESGLSSVSENELKAQADVRALAASGDNIANGSYKNITWVIDASGKLTVEGTGEFADLSVGGNNTADYYRAPWYDQASKIKTAQIHVSGMTDASHMFHMCTNLTRVDLKGFDTSTVTNMEEMFGCCSNLESLDLSSFDTSKVTNMASMFGTCNKLSNLNLSGFDTSNVITMQGMFNSCRSLTKVDLSSFNTANVENMANMFTSCSNLKSLDLSNFNTGKVTRMDWMFSECQRMTDVKVDRFSTANVETMEGMFAGCSQLTKLNVSSFDTSCVDTMRYMFRGCSMLKELDASHFNAVNVTDMDSMFANCYGLTSLDVSGLNTCNVTKMSSMFSGCSALGNLDLSHFNTSKVTDMRDMFSGCNALSSLDLRNFDTSAVRTGQNTSGLVHMFYRCTNLTDLNISSFDVSNTDSLYGMFSGCSKLKHIELGNLNTDNITDMHEMFADCSSLTALDLSGFNTAKVTDMRNMFSGCTSLTDLNLNGFDTANVTLMYGMFKECTSLTDLDLSSFNTANVTDMRNMFYHCENLKNLDLSSFEIGKVTTMEWMFANCSSLTDLDLSTFDFSNVANPYGMFTSCSKMEKIYTPYNVKANARVTLPTKTSSDVWYRSDDKTEIKTLPEGLDHSILITRNKVSEATARISARKARTAYTCDDQITLDDLIVTCYGKDGSVKRLTQEQYTTNASQIDMTEPGEKKLVITYQAGDAALSAEIILTVTCGLTSDNTVVTLPEESEYNYTYNGEAKTPLPTVSYRKTASDNSQTPVTLVEGTDYTVSYSNNINAYVQSIAKIDAEEPAAAPTIIIKGMGSYSGTVTKTFTIKKAQAPAAEEKNVIASRCTQANSNRTIDLSESFADFGKKTGYEVTGVEDAENIFSRTPATKDIKNGVLTYGTKAAQENDAATIKIKISFVNYEDAELTVKITMAAKKGAAISGITIPKNTVYSGMAVSYVGTASVKAEDGTDVTNQVTLVYSYSGTLADGTAYPAQAQSGATGSGGQPTGTAPVNAGSYVLTVAVAEDEDYMGSMVYPFTISPAAVTVTARDIVDVMQESQGATKPVASYQSEFKYNAKGLLNEDHLNKEPTYTVTDQDGSIVTQIDLTKEAVYHIVPSGADAGMNYAITYVSGTLTVSEERVVYTVRFDCMGHGSSFVKNGIKAGSLLKLSADELTPKAEGYIFAGWYQDKSFAKGREWNFDTNTVQSDLTLYACWLTGASVDGGGLKLWVQEIPDLTYTGSALKPTINVYDSDGTTLLKAGKDYTIKYVRNTDAVKTGQDGKPVQDGGTAKVENPGKTNEKITNVIGQFSKECPYVVITGKGNYTETIYRNFHILPANITAAEEADSTSAADNVQLAAGFTLKYTDQFEAKANKTAKIVSSFKYKKALKEDKDYVFKVQDENGADVKLVQGKLPLNKGNYTLTVTGMGNYTGTVRRKLYVADKQKLMKNASVTYTKTVKAVNAAELAEGVEQTSVKVKTSGNEVNPENYKISYAGTNHAVGTATMTITGMNEYVGTKSVIFKITGMPFSAKTIEVRSYNGNQPDENDWKASMPYTGKAVTQNKVTLTAKITNDNPTARTLTYGEEYTISYTNNVKKGTAAMVFTAKPESGYSGSFKKTFKITPQNLSADMFRKVLPDGTTQQRQIQVVSKDENKNNVTVRWDEDAVHIGNGASLSFTLCNSEGVTLKQGTDYTVSYKDHKAATKESAGGSVTAGSKQPVMTVKGKGNYSGTLSVQFQIIPASITSDSLTVTAAQVQRKNGMKLKDFKLKVMDGKAVLKEGKDYTVDDAACTPEIIKTYADSLGTEGTAPEPKLVLTGIGNYGAKTAEGGTAGDRKEISLADYIYVTKMTAKNIKVEVTGSRTYTGQNVEPTVKVSYYKDNNAAKQGSVGAELTNGTDYKVTYGSKNIPAGKKKGSITVTGAGIFGGSVTVKFDIEKKQIY